MTCTGPGGTASQNTTVTVAASAVPAPVVTLTATPSSIPVGATSVVAWSSTNSTSCTSSSGGGTGTTGSFTTPSLSTSTAYTVTCAGAGGSASQNIVVTVASTPVSPAAPSTIASVQAAWAATPLPDTASGMNGTVHYFCDCGTGASGSCVAGSDSNNGLTTSTPKQTIAAAFSALNSSSVGDTIALCKGGAFNASTGANIKVTCTPGTYCRDFREFSPTTFSSTAQPIINAQAGLGANGFITSNGSYGGVRFLNVTFKGPAAGFGFLFWNGVHDVLFGNDTIDNFSDNFYLQSSATQPNDTNITLTGNTISNAAAAGFLGSGDALRMNYNSWINDGSNSSLNHAIYFSAHRNATDVQLVGNYVYGQNGTTCLGGPVVAHGELTNFTISNNWVEIAPAATTGGCYGISINNNATTYGAQFFRNTVISNNTMINPGSLGIQVTTCPSCLIENNNIVFNTITQDSLGIQTGAYAASTTAGDDVNTANKILNNTIYFGLGATGFVRKGIQVATEGTGHIVANNTISSYPTSGSVSCFSYFVGLTLANYAFSNNNDCYSATTYTWETAHGSTLAAWQSYATSYGFDTASMLSNPSFTAPAASPPNLVPQAGSPLLGAGTHIYAPATDALGVSRPNPPAIGAYEQ